MSRYIDAEKPFTLISRLMGCIPMTLLDEYEKNGIDIVRCKECKYGEYREDFDDYECHSSGCGLVYDADFFCADGERRNDG